METRHYGPIEAPAGCARFAAMGVLFSAFFLAYSLCYLFSGDIDLGEKLCTSTNADGQLTAIL